MLLSGDASNNPDHQSLHSILAVRLSALGDIILLIPTLRRIARSFPNTKLSWLVDPIFLPLLPHLHNIELIPIRKPRRIKDYWRIYHSLRHRRFDCLLAFQSSLRSHLIYPLIHAPLKLGYSNQQAKDLHTLFVNTHLPFKKEHLLDTAWRFADYLGATDQTLDWGFTFTEEENSWANRLLMGAGPWLAINPGASKPERSCRADFYVDLILRILAAYPVQIILTGGNNHFEMTLAATITQKCPHRLINLVGQTSLRELAIVLNHCDLTIAPDTGPLHLADALGKPVIGLYAVAPPELSGPYHYPHWVVNQYPEAARRYLGKEPEQLPWVTRIHHPEAMSLIQVSAVLDRVSQWWTQFHTVTTHHQ